MQAALRGSFRPGVWTQRGPQHQIAHPCSAVNAPSTSGCCIGLVIKPYSMCKTGKRAPTVFSSSSSGSSTDVESFMLPPITSDNQLQQDKNWLAVQVTTWLNEEWTPLDIHAQVGEAAGEAYVAARRAGEDEVGGVLLAVGSQLLVFDFHDTFVNGFEVANKVSELLMLRAGCDVCCTSVDDRERVLRVDDALAGLVAGGAAPGSGSSSGSSSS
eukprot:CAMPEP_0202861580 /NCGR_PEP_ID=MMETSP1391-20130828/2933_1 /ASSEMBLY_ACC=CAM_ASM_000867 /TAXON_ID=1034604 /ORGANISM="Chlamydomonas leiostraca, Strain SAG 11-49" /LENGTH=213 /DNA_ID=CAMNT_0049540995 /DNA_START=11 /DNA_END=652 /DNA_ORIENTATION=-